MQIENNAWFVLMGNDSHQGKINRMIQEVERKLRKQYYSAFQVMDAINQVCNEAERFRIAELLSEAEANDVEPVVRCKDCKWFGDIGCAIQITDDSDKPKETDYCSFGERREDNGKREQDS